MNAQDLLDYTLGLLDEPHRSQLETELTLEPALAIQAERLGQAIDLLLDDGQVFEPPPDLARRTLARVEDLGRRPKRSVLDFVPVRVPFRWADVAVAAGIFLAALATLLPAVQKSRVRAEQAACALNLQQLGTGLSLYAGAYHSYPYAQGCSAPYAGTFAVLLNDAGFLPSPTLLHCPHNRHKPAMHQLPNFDALCAAEECAPLSSPCLKNVDYAYNLGYQRDGCAGPILPDQAPGLTPLLADLPPFKGPREILAGNSPNHDGAGQSVLYAGGHVKWHPSRRLGPNDEDMFLNANRRSAPGVGQWDAVLSPGIVRFDGQ
jgi:hypothetical protein